MTKIHVTDAIHNDLDWPEYKVDNAKMQKSVVLRFLYEKQINSNNASTMEYVLFQITEFCIQTTHLILNILKKIQ